MSATNSTPIINLPLFIGTDKPAWLTDWNGAMNTIDSSIAALQTAEAGTASSLATLAQSVEALSGTVEQHTTAIQTVTTATSGNTASINTINSLIGNGQPTTEDKTIIGAINEIYADQGELADLSTTDKSSLVAAINELTGDSGAVIKSAAFSGTTSSIGQYAIELDKLIAPLGLHLQTFGSAYGGYIFTSHDSTNNRDNLVIQLDGGTVASQQISGTYYYAEL